MVKITVYGTKTCPYCIKLKKWLDDRGIEYASYDIDENPIAAANMHRISKQDYVPFSTIELSDGKIENVLGCDTEKFEAVLKTVNKR